MIKDLFIFDSSENVLIYKYLKKKKSKYNYLFKSWLKTFKISFLGNVFLSNIFELFK